MPAYLGSTVAFPKGEVPVASLRKKLTLSFRPMGEQEDVKVCAYDEDDHYLYVPRAYGMKLISDGKFEVVDQRSSGQKVHYPRVVTHEGDWSYQDAFVKNILRAVRASNDCLIHAATGKGKTVCSLSVIQKLERNAIVLVDQENLMTQWVEQARTVLGLRASDIGIVQGSRCEYRGKKIVVAMIHSLVQREYDEAFYSYFGTMVVDEVHGAGAPTFSRALMMFSAEYRFGVSATIDRRDALQNLLHWNLGTVDVALTDKHDSSYVYYLTSDTVYSWYANISPKSGRMLTEVGEDAVRNQKLVDAILWLYESGRDTLVISDRIEQLEAIKAMVELSGVDPAHTGLYCGFQTVWRWEKDPTPKRRPYGYEPGTEYTPVRLTTYRRKKPKRELDEIKERASIIFATFGMFAKGVDVPRLSGGVDCTPRSRAQQVHGRILRKREGKLVPIWVTMRDICNYKLEHQFAARLAEYEASSARIYEWQPDKGVRLVDVKALQAEVRRNVARLQKCEIRTSDDGTNTLLTLGTPRDSAGPRSTATAVTTRSRPVASRMGSMSRPRSGRSG